MGGALVLFLSVSIFMPYAPRKGAGRISPADDKAVAQPYRIISAADTQELFAYELHKKRLTQYDYTEYCAVIRNIDPAKDDYKAYCRSVVADIIKTEGNNRIWVTIYDSNEAYDLYEVRFSQQYQNLDTAQSGIVEKHHVATYVGNSDSDYGTHHQLSYYEDAKNGLAQHETYQP